MSLECGCGLQTFLSLDSGPDIPGNAIRVCQSCNSGKGGRRLYEWKGLWAKDENV
jgi:hypothetical protein